VEAAELEPAGQASASLDTAHLELYRPALLAIDQQVRALTIELEKAAPAQLPTGMGALSSVVISREICNWQRFKNMEIAGCGLFWLSWHGAWCAFSPDISRCRTGSPSWQKEPERPRGAAQEGHCCRGSSARCGPLEASYRALHTHDPRIQVKAKEVFLRSSHKHKPFGTWRVFAA
jgi:hypothetical protein